MNFLSKIPASMTVLLVVMGSLAPLLFICFNNDPRFNILITTLYIALGAIAGLGCLVFERGKKTKANDFAKDVETNAASSEGLKDPHKIAQMDHMRKEFQRGIDIYKKHGKNLYSLPWYVVVGESESGKTEMLRRSEIGFPDKLQDRWQGSGGTLSMHWWFTSKAVILDTAGRLFVTEGADSGQSQWVNFLQMLKKNRPDCPINGLILVIPSNRLLTHPDPELEAVSTAKLDENAGQIARQMETLQSELGVRFPVYILITKMDKMNGFREFFGKIDKPEDRYQIMGWSNPGPLGDTFDTQSVADYIRTVGDRLRRRMMSDLRNVEPDDPNGLRIDEVDGLYAFPSTFESMSGKLTRYLRHVFTTDEWSAKPPFLRGIYFTSALQQGKVLDEALAAAMGVAFDKMDATQQDDGLSLSKNRTYFVRDLFLDKIFNEKGLVTTAGKIKSRITGWKLWVPAMLLLMLALFGLIGYFTLNAKDEAGAWRRIWDSDAGLTGKRILPLVSVEKGVVRASNAAKSTKLVTALAEVGEYVQGPPKFGWVFKPAQIFDGKLSASRRDLYVDLVAESVADCENAMVEKYKAECKNAHEWTETDWQALHALIILHNGSGWEHGKLSLAPDDGSPWETRVLFEALFKAAEVKVSPKTFDQCVQYAAKLSPTAFQKLLTERVKEGDGVILHELLPPDKLTALKKANEAMNKFYQKISMAKDHEAPELTAALELSSQLEAGESETLVEDDGEPVKTAPKLVTDRDALIAFVMRNPRIADRYSYDTETVKLEAGAQALAGNPKLIRQVVETLKIITGKTTLGAANLESFIGKSPSDAAQGEDKALKAVHAQLVKLKKSWFKKEFYRKRFHEFLRFPIVADAPVGSNEELQMLWNLIKLGDDWGVADDGIAKLRETFDYFFVSEKIQELGIAGTLRPCQMEFVKIKDQSIAKYTVMAGDKLVGEFRTDAALTPAPNTPINQTLSFTKEGADDGKLPPWELARKINPGQQHSWRHTTLSGASYDLSIPGKSLRQWSKTSDFKPQP